MSPAEFDVWMKKNGLSEIDIAAFLKIHPITITRFLKGKRVQRSTHWALERLVQSGELSRTNRKVAVG